MSAEIIQFPMTREEKAIQTLREIRQKCRPAILKIQRRRRWRARLAGIRSFFGLSK